ncbi:MAG: hypothetical protein JF603_14260 [Acidobacteria bacterium]|nr:hypothetical protein [Acidobacteriota bacterium]
METYVVRVWLPDRPGALGQVASRIGAVRGDLVGIDILERGAGRAIDELVVQLPEAGLVDLLISELRAVDGVAVEDIQPAAQSMRDPRLDALETAAMLVGAVDVDELLGVLVQHAALDFGVDWATVVDLEGPEIRASVGPTPEAAWLEAFVEGSRSSARVAAGEAGPDDVAWAPLPSARLSVVIGRKGRPLRARERRQVAALARIADTRWAEVVSRRSQSPHASK